MDRDLAAFEKSLGQLTHKEEGVIPPDRSARREAKLLVVQLRLRRQQLRLRGQRLVAVVVVGAAEGVGARLDHRIDRGALVAPGFRARLRYRRELLDRVNRKCDPRVPETPP